MPGIMTSFCILPFLISFCKSLDEQLLFPHLLAVFINKNSVGNDRRLDFIQDSLGLIQFFPSCIRVISHRLAHILVHDLRKCSVSSYVTLLVSLVLLFSSLILTKTFPVQSPGATQLFFLSSKTFNPNTCVHTLAVGDSNISHSISIHVSPWNFLNISCAKFDLGELTFHSSCLTASNPNTSFHQCSLVQILSSISFGTSYFFLPPFSPILRQQFSSGPHWLT